MFYRTFIKRPLDFLASLLLLLLTLPLTLPTALALAIANGGSIFFLQKRPGKGEKPFTIFKFKTMNDRKDEHGHLLPDEVRLTKTGRFVRKTSIDELPQLINVLKGDISLIGPRPLLMEYLSLYNERQKRRHEVRPGISGWAQVNGRNAIDWDTKFELDVYYVEHQSLWLDLRILFMTIYNVLTAKGISSGSSATMEKFTGSNRGATV